MNKKWNVRSVHRAYVGFCALMLAICIVLACLSAGLLENKLGWVVDCSRSSVFTLSSETQRLLSGLQEDVWLYAVYENGKQDHTVEQVLGSYARASERIHSAVLDPVDDVNELLPFTKGGDAIESGSIIVSSATKDNFIALDYYDFYLVGANGITGIQAEQSISSAIAHLQSGSQGRVVFMNAHAQTTIATVPAFATNLTASGYGLFQSADAFSRDFAAMLVPQTDLLVYLSPVSDLSEAEADALIDYMRSGGRVLAMMDYTLSVDNGMGIRFNYESLPNFQRVFEAAGMRLEQELIVLPETAANLGSITRFSATVVANGWLDAAVGDAMPVLSECAPIEILNADLAQPLLVSPDESYQKRIAKDLQGIEWTRSDPTGARCVCAYGKVAEGGLILLGTSSAAMADFALNANRKLIMQVTSTLLDDGDNPIIAPVMTVSGKLRLSNSTQQVVLIAAMAGALPLTVLLVGALVIHRRRKRSGRVKHD